MPGGQQQPSVLSRVGSELGREAIGSVKGVGNDAVTAYHIARGTLDEPEDATETLVRNTGGPSALVAYRGAKGIVDSVKNYATARKDDFQEAKLNVLQALEHVKSSDWQNAVADIVGAGSDVIGRDPMGQIGKEISAGIRPGGDLATPLTKAGVLAGTLVGMKKPEVAGEAGEAVGKIPGKIAEKAGDIREGIGNKYHLPEGGKEGESELTPGAKAMSRAAGTAAGGAIGASVGNWPGAVVGGTAGGLAGPTMFERMFPESAERIAARKEFLNTKTLTEAQEEAIKENETFDAAKQKEVEQQEKEINDAKKARDDHYNEMAEGIMRRGKDIDKMEADAVKAENAAERARRSTVVGKEPIGPEVPPELDYEARAQELMQRQKEQDALDKDATQKRKEVEAEKEKSNKAYQDDLKKQQDLHDQFAKKGTRLRKVSSEGTCRQSKIGRFVLQVKGQSRWRRRGIANREDYTFP